MKARLYASTTFLGEVDVDDAALHAGARLTVALVKEHEHPMQFKPLFLTGLLETAQPSTQTRT